jgi:3-oxoacyl-[acyl-carrier-protein] synthase III
MPDRAPTDSVGIAGAAFHLPGPPQDLVDWIGAHPADPQVVAQLLDQGCRYFHEGPAHADADLIADSIDQLLARDTAWLPQVRYLVHAAGQNFSMPAPPSSILSELVARYRMRPALCFSVGHLGCAAAISAVAWAARLLGEDPAARYALVVTSDRVFGGARYRLRAPGAIQSDGASAILLSKTGWRGRIGRIDTCTAPKLHEGPSTAANQRAIARETWIHTRQLLRQHSAAAGLALADYPMILPFNTDRAYWIQIARGLKLPESRFFLDNIYRRGHACCADLAVNLVDLGFTLLDQGKPVLVCGQSYVGAHAAFSLFPPAAGQAPATLPAEEPPCA